jgi:hypothetical protein
MDHYPVLYLNSFWIAASCNVLVIFYWTKYFPFFAFVQQQDSITAKNRRAFASVDFDRELGGQFQFSDHDNT